MLKSPALDFPSEVIEAEGSGGVSRSVLGRHCPAIRQTTEDPDFDSLLSGNTWVFVMSATPGTQHPRPHTRSLGYDDSAREINDLLLSY